MLLPARPLWLSLIPACTLQGNVGSSWCLQCAAVVDLCPQGHVCGSLKQNTRRQIATETQHWESQSPGLLLASINGSRTNSLKNNCSGVNSIKDFAGSKGWSIQGLRGDVWWLFPIAQKMYVIVFCYKQARAPMELWEGIKVNLEGFSNEKWHTGAVGICKWEWNRIVLALPAVALRAFGLCRCELLSLTLLQSERPTDEANALTKV